MTIFVAANLKVAFPVFIGLPSFVHDQHGDEKQHHEKKFDPHISRLLY